jgi:2-polyprenyl-6-methoxyphenol hydroxylase-like FAD-dependent oxidoreductase
MVVIGDAAHQFLPHTGQGANQAIEDAAVLAICLQLASRSNNSSSREEDGVPLALRVMERLRQVFDQPFLVGIDSNINYFLDTDGSH